MLLESQKTGFNKKIKAAYVLGSNKMNQKSLIKKKKKRVVEDLKKKKRKSAEEIARKYCEGVNLLSKLIGEEEYSNYIKKVAY